MQHAPASPVETLPGATTSDNEPSIVLEARGLARTFSTGTFLKPGKVSAVAGVDLQLRQGEVLGIVGESGCGKSTLARMLVGLDAADEGELHFKGQHISLTRRKDRALLREGIQMIFQDPYTSLNPRMTVREIIAEPLAAARIGTSQERHERAGELLSLVGLAPDMLSRFPHQFSGGQRQRIGIARALAKNPSVLVCDEPVSALDVSVQAQVINLLSDIRDRLGISVVFIAHDLSVVRHLADRVAVMYLGRVVEQGPTEEVYDTPAHPYTQALLSAVPPGSRAERGKLSQRRVLPGEPPSPLNPPAGCRFNPRCVFARPECSDSAPLLLPAPTQRTTESPAPETHLAACHFAHDLVVHE